MKTIDIERLKDNLLTLAEIGKDETGGVTRLAYSEEYYRGIDLVKKWMEEASLSVVIDPVYNVLGTREGKTNKVMLIGSHTDTVEHGGIFDGCLGVLGAIEALRIIDREGIELEHTVVVANWAEEEGNVIKGLIGSGSFVGKMDDSIPAIEDKLGYYGIYPEDIKNAKYKDLDKVEKYLELRIEQGGVLESMKKDIGVVSSIVGEERYMVTVHGRENHAGTTPMKYRDDALIKASKMMLSLNEKCKEIDDTMVVTVGWIKAFPGEQNIIPGKVQMTVEIRSVHEQSIRKLVDHMKELCVQYDCDFELTLTQNPTVMSRLCMEAIHESAEELGLSDMVMQSGAGHDAMMIANVIRDTGMIFAPSKGGVSHCPQEWTEWSDVENSVNVLLHTILKLDKK